MNKYFLFSKSMLLSLMVLLAVGCSKDEPFEPPINSRAITVLVANEGNFGQSNATLTGINVQDSIIQNVFRLSNAGRPLGDGAQSITEIGDNLYVCVNNSGKIEVINKMSFASVATILLEGSNPMYMQQINDSLAAVTNLYLKDLFIINTKSNKLSRKVQLPNPGEQMTMAGTSLVVATVSPWVSMEASRTESLTIIDTKTFAVTKSVEIDAHLLFNYGKLCTDERGQIWKMTSSAFVCFNAAAGEISQTKEIPTEHKPGWTARYDISPDKKVIAYATGDNKIAFFDLASGFKAGFPLTDVASFYNLAFSPQGDLFVADAADYVTKGQIIKYKTDGTKVKQFEVGILPQSIFFYK